MMRAADLAIGCTRQNPKPADKERKKILSTRPASVPKVPKHADCTSTSHIGLVPTIKPIEIQITITID